MHAQRPAKHIQPLKFHTGDTHLQIIETSRQFILSVQFTRSEERRTAELKFEEQAKKTQAPNTE